MSDFATYDQRHYRTVSTKDGYAAWQPTYEASVADAMDLSLLDRVRCGTGRTAAWLTSRGVNPIDGVDVTPEMLAVARSRALHRELVEADVRECGLRTDSYDAVVCSLVDEHLSELAPLYREAARLLRAGGYFVIVGFHPYFIMATGMPTHFDDEGESVAIETHVHLPSEHMAAAELVGMRPVEFYEAVIDAAWITRRPSWERHRGWPISYAWVWQA